MKFNPISHLKGQAQNVWIEFGNLNNIFLQLF